MKQPVEHTVTFDKSRYHQHLDMCIWCSEHCGFGKWLSGTPKTWAGLEKLNWSVDSIFGNTTFAFKEPTHLIMFVLRWR